MRTFFVVPIAFLGACLGSSPDEVQSTSSELSGREGKIDFAVDAPWRVEPVVTADGMDYGPVPIQITIDDAHLAAADDYGGLGNLIDITVQQEVQTPFLGSAAPPPPRVYELADLAEIEVEGGPWPYTGADDAAERLRPLHVVCEPWKGESCASAGNVGNSAKWYALAWYDLNDTDIDLEPGDDVPLTVTVRVSTQLDDGDPYGELVLKGHLLVHLGEEPLPTFGAGWVYGDLHYHSQATDNEGESGHSYRGVVRALGTLGMGFAFATDHASYSEQLVDLDIDRWKDVHNKAVYDVDLVFDGLRDLSPERWRYAIERLHDVTNGANQAASDNQHGIELQSVRQKGVTPRLFLGAEVDVGPEVTVGERYSGVHFGNGRVHEFGKLCDALGGVDDLVSAFLGDNFDCEISDFTEKSPSDWHTYWVKDWQGFGLDVARQHVLHLPSSADPEAFVASESTLWGGGSRAIQDVLGAAGQSGVTFLAHPLSSQESPHPGPAAVPYSEYQLKRAFAEPTMLGLQLWNEDGRLATKDGDYGFLNTGAFGPLDDDHAAGTCTDDPRRCTLELVPTKGVTTSRIWEWARSTTPTFGDMQEPFAPAADYGGLYSRLHHGTYTWDQVNLWGLDPDYTAPLAWVPDGDPRRMFAAAGSDAHGDFNYRQSGYFFGTDEVNTTALGTPRNLVDVGALERVPSDSRGGDTDPVRTFLSQENVVSALSEGRFSITDGPALRIVIDNDRDGQIGPGDTPMGGIVHLYGDEPIPLLVEWKSTPEFGPVDEVHLYVAAVTDGDGRIYAPGNHGVRSGPDPTTAFVRSFNGDDGKLYYQMDDTYFLDPTAYGEAVFESDPQGVLTLRTNYRGGDEQAYEHVQEVLLDPAAFPSGYGPTTGMFVRAFAKTAPRRWSDCENLAEGESLHAQGKCLVRLAYTNPIWAMPQEWSFGDECPADDRGIDRDGDELPDGCDACPDDPAACDADEGRIWSRQFGGASIDWVDGLAHDAEGHVYVAGHFQGTATFAGQTLVSDGAYDGFVAKLSRTGELLWLEHIGGSGNMRISALVVDDAGAVTFAGWFGNRMNFDSYYIMDAPSGDMFIGSIMENAAGDGATTRWLRRLGGSGFDSIRGLALGPDDSVYAVGSFNSQLYLWGKSSGDIFSTLTSGGGYDCVMVRFTRSAGNVTGSRQVSGSGHCFAEGVAVLDDHATTIVGRYSGQARFDPNDPTLGVRWSNTGYNGFAATYVPTVNGSSVSSYYWPSWNVSFGDTAGNCGDGDARAFGIAEQNGELVIVGDYRNCVVAHGWDGAQRLGTAWDSYSDGFVARLGPSGNVIASLRAEGFGGDIVLHNISATDAGYAISASSRASLIELGGAWFGSVPANSPWGAAVVMVGADDEVSWAERIPGAGHAYGYEVSLYDDGFVAVGGRFDQSLAAPDLPSLTSAGSGDGFVYQTR